MNESDYLHERVHENGLRTVEGTVLSFAIGKTNRNVAVGIIQKAMENITIDELIAIFTKIENTHSDLPKLSPREKSEKLKHLKEALGLN